MSTSVIQTVNKVVSDGSTLFTATATNDFFWLTTGVVAAADGYGVKTASFKNVDIQIDGSLEGRQIDIDIEGGANMIRVG